MSMQYSKEELLQAFHPIKLKEFFEGNPTMPYIMFDHQEIFVSVCQNPENLKQNPLTTNEINNIDDNLESESIYPNVICTEEYYPPQRQEIFYRFPLIVGNAKSRNSGSSQKGLSNLKNISSATSSRNGSFMQTSMCSSNTPGGSKRNSNCSVQIKRSSKNYIQDIITECRRGSGTKRSESPALQNESSPKKRNSKSATSPFSQSPMMKSVQLDERGWFYIDEQDCIQGPFTSIEMDNWYLKGYFLPTLLVGFKNTNKKLFFQLQNLYQPPKHHRYLNREVKEFLKNEKSNLKKRSASYGPSQTNFVKNKTQVSSNFNQFVNNGDSPSSIYISKNYPKRVRHSSILNSTPRACLKMDEMINQLLSKQSNGGFSALGCVGSYKQESYKPASNTLILANQSSQQKSSEVFSSENEQYDEYNINESQNEDNNSTNETPLAKKKRLSDVIFVDVKDCLQRNNKKLKEKQSTKLQFDKVTQANKIDEDYSKEDTEQKKQLAWRTEKPTGDSANSLKFTKPQINNSLHFSKRTETQELE
ncbi:GYF domain protein (macronuclear) [Tetrahymena thermophila SB210]|uniref:GYF domain protein n=1 Tax=Tetrahymena thermophila (strain SB210) TaxID=312017 RepID=I7M174_TETTS|nr:GYF domain protein [Tetrahymena thermophila SB210]EAR95634.1 GYF domain protein [Tetrahymena thermophila SB210]|eukprot:XP_001015879.1 GYF domain protein [Tetrahymena thermophila SB210]